MIYVPGVPLWSGLVIAFAARNSAAYFHDMVFTISQGKVWFRAGQRPARHH
jgi:hypothetical protein